VITGSEERTISLEKWLEDQGIWASAIRPPTVEKGASRIRITLTDKHSPDDIDRLIQAFREWNP
ncbi:MAG: 8-amino-7-oxononanoate synthase, partial [Balneolaceae bacterium]